MTALTDTDGIAVLTVSGELDLGTAGQLEEAIAGAADGHDGPLVVDLAGLTFCDSAGLAVFVRTQNRLGGQGRRFVLAQAAPNVARIFELSGVDQVITTAPTTADACLLAKAP